MLWFLNHTKLMNISISYLPQKQVNPLPRHPLDIVAPL